MNHRIVLLAVCVGMLLVGTASAWYNFGWDYRKEFTINNTGSALTNYQIMFTVNRSAGSDSGTTVYLDGKCEEDYDDVRFVASDDTTVLDYWIESSSATVASVWVELNSLPTGDTDFYLYYGNSGASAVSNGDNTFQFFDDFLGSSLDAGKWSVISGSPSVSGGKLSFSNAAEVRSKSTFAAGSALEVYGTLTLSGSVYNSHGLAAYSPEQRIVFHGDYPNSNNYGANFQKDGGSWNTSNIGATYTGIRRWSILRPDTTNAYWLIDGNQVRSANSGLYTGSMGIHFYSNGAATPSWDWIAIRKFTATEPTISAWGSEESDVRSTTAEFSALPLTGNIPLTVYFTDESTGNNCTVDAWAWSFGDSSPNSTQQNPAHTYTTTGLYDVILTAFNTSYSKSDTEKKTAYINATYDPNAPTADFTVTETCGETTDTFYFIDFSTGGGLYAWNWSFGDGSYSELRNPTHQYAANGTYDVTLTVTGAYGSDSLLRENLITIPCGAATPTPTPTPTPTVTPTGTGNVTEGNATYIYAPDQDYVPFPIWLAIVIVTIALFGHSLIFLKNSDLTAIMAALFAMLSAWLSNMIGYIDVQVTSYAEEIVISPVVQAVHPPWLVYTMLIFAFVSVVNIFAAIYKVYLKPVPWNEIYDRKLPKWGRRK